MSWNLDKSKMTDFDEYVLDEKYIGILFDESFVKTIIMRNNPEFNTYDYNRQMMNKYNIPILEINSESDCPWDYHQVLRLVDSLKNIEKDINYYEENSEKYTAEAIGFFALIEALSGKRNFTKLCYLVFNDMWR